jgi:hypothetical protein
MTPDKKQPVVSAVPRSKYRIALANVRCSILDGNFVYYVLGDDGEWSRVFQHQARNHLVRLGLSRKEANCQLEGFRERTFVKNLTAQRNHEN